MPASRENQDVLLSLLDLRTVILWQSSDAHAVELTFVSPSVEDCLGYRRDEWSSHSFFLEHIPNEDRPSLLRVFYSAASRGEVFSCEHRIRKSDESTIWVRTVVSRASPEPSGGLIGLTVDLSTDLERGATAGSIRGLADLNRIGLLILGSEGEVTFANRGASRILGYSTEEILLASLGRFLCPEHSSSLIANRLISHARREGESEHEGWLLRRDGERFWGELVIEGIRYSGEKTTGFRVAVTDLDSRHRREESLARSEADFRLLVKTLQDYALFTMSTTGDVETWNVGAQRLKGYRGSEAIGRPLSLFLPPEEVDKGTPERLIEQAKTQGAVDYEGWLIRKGGKRFWGFLTLGAVEDENGDLRAISNIARDLTDRKKADDALRENEERLTLLLDSIKDYSVFMLDIKGDVKSWSKGGESLQGYQAEEIIGAPFSKFFAPQEVVNEDPDRLMKQAAEEGRAQYEGWMVAKGGKIFWAELVLHVVKERDGSPRGYSAVVRDLTDRLQATRAQAFLSYISSVLARSLDVKTTVENLARLSISELAHTCVIHHLIDDTILVAGVAHRDTEVEEFLRQKLLPLNNIEGTGTVVAAVLATDRAQWSTGRVKRNFYHQLFNLDPASSEMLPSNTCWISAPLTARGKTLGVLTVLSESDSSYTDQDFDLVQELGRRAALAIDNARLYEEAQRAVRLREEVLAIVSHDLRSPLQAIKFASGHLLRGLADNVSESTRLSVEGMKTATDRMSRMIKDLIDFSSIEAGKLRMNLKPVEAAALAEGAIAGLAPLAEEKGVTLHCVLPPVGILLNCDNDRLLQVFSNIIGNAIKFTETGGRVSLCCSVELDRVIFKVEDTGSGIAEENLTRVFDRYWQGVVGTEGSIGLGLAIARAIIEAHGGEIRVESKIGVGTVFTLSLKRYYVPVTGSD